MRKKIILISLTILILAVFICLFKTASFYKKTFERTRAIKLSDGGFLFPGEEPPENCLNFDFKKGFSSGYKVKLFISEQCCSSLRAESCLLSERESGLESIVKTYLIKLFMFYNQYGVHFAGQFQAH